MSLTFLSIFTFYYSTVNGDVNLQVTNMDWEGTEWIFDHKNKQIMTDELGISQWRFYSAIYGIKEYNLIKSVGQVIKSPPDHFSYNNKTSLGAYYNESRYLIITSLGRIFYPEAYPDYKKYWRFSPKDFDKLESDDTVMKIYTNGDFDAFFIKSSRI